MYFMIFLAMFEQVILVSLSCSYYESQEDEEEI